MEEHPDPGWRPAFPVAAGMLLGRGPVGSILLVMRAVTLILVVVAALTTLVVLASVPEREKPMWIQRLLASGSPRSWGLR